MVRVASRLNYRKLKHDTVITVEPTNEHYWVERKTWNYIKGGKKEKVGEGMALKRTKEDILEHKCYYTSIEKLSSDLTKAEENIRLMKSSHRCVVTT